MLIILAFIATHLFQHLLLIWFHFIVCSSRLFCTTSIASIYAYNWLVYDIITYTFGLGHYNLYIWIRFTLLCISPILFYPHKQFVDIFLEMSNFFDQAFNMRPLKVVLLIHVIQVLLQVHECDLWHEIESNSMCKFIFKFLEGKVNAMINSSK
jgi:hypothetical protein